MKKINSPCIKVCKVKDSRCTSCGRSLDEIRRWSKMEPLERITIMIREQLKKEENGRT